MEKVESREDCRSVERVGNLCEESGMGGDMG